MIICEMALMKCLLGRKEHENRLLWLLIIVPSLIMQILYTPSTVESFFWYTGAVNYTFIYSLSMVFISIFLILNQNNLNICKRMVLSITAVVLAVIIGGNNFSTSLSVLVSMLVYYFGLVITKRREHQGSVKQVLIRTGYLVLVTGVSLAACILAPGNRTRLDENFQGSPNNGAL